MKRLWIALAVVFAAIIGSGALHQYLYPIPSWMIGTWENDELFGLHGPGVIQLTFSRDGTLDLAFADVPGRIVGHQWLAPTRFCVRVVGDTATVWHGPSGDDKTKEFHIKHDGERMSTCEIRPRLTEGVYVTPSETHRWRRVF